MSEAAITRRIQVALTDADTRIWRNQVGQAWQGIVTRNRDGSITIRNPRPVTFGLCEGSSDLIGARSVQVTPEMVGRRVAVFAAVEVKTDTGRATDMQQQFIQTVRFLGGFAGIARSVEEGKRILGGVSTE